MSLTTQQSMLDLNNDGKCDVEDVKYGLEKVRPSVDVCRSLN